MTMKRGFWFMAAAVWCIMAALPVRAEASDKKTYTLAVVPQLRATEIYAKWTPFARRMSQELGVDIQITAYPSLRQEPPDIRNQLEVIYQTPGFASHPLAPKDLQRKFVQAVLALAKDAKNQGTF